MKSLCTSRLMGRELCLDDYMFLRQLHSDLLAMREVGGIRDEIKTRENLEWNLAHWKSHDFGLWVFSMKESGLSIGLVGIREIEFLEKFEIDLAFMLIPKFWNLGFASEASKSILELAFQQLHISSVIAKTRTSNFASQRVIQKLGFTLEREVVDFGNPHFQYRITSKAAQELMTQI